jgi:hypothetical protein
VSSSRHGVEVSPFPLERFTAAKRAFTTRRIPLEDLAAHGLTLLSGAVRPRSGDVVLATVDRIGQHARIELPSGRRAQMNVGDEIIVAYADRYAPDQYEAEVPLRLNPTSLVASGGVAAQVKSRNGGIRQATDITPVGLLADRNGTPINVAQFRIDFKRPTTARPRTIAVFGTSMNSGKTTTVKNVVRGLHLSGRRPGATKVTGTGSGNDYWAVLDAGAAAMIDFTDAGLASTYRIPFPVVEAVFVRLVDHLTNLGCSDIIVEVADGLFQAETWQLARSEVFRSYIDHVVFAAGEAMGAVAGVAELRAIGLPIIGATGLMTKSPLAHREAAAHLDVPILSSADLADPTVAQALMTGDDFEIRTALASRSDPLPVVERALSSGHELVPQLQIAPMAARVALPPPSALAPAAMLAPPDGRSESDVVKAMAWLALASQRNGSAA